ncbi:MAG: hypothetical protein K6G81_12215 [Lachnospiraceae bacterium]|nr:hypothetical protein [Lachnospiraceae bacterium]
MEDIIKTVCPSVTEQVSGISLKNADSKPISIDNPISVVVMSRGNFMSKAIMTLPLGFVKKIVDGMSRGMELSSEDREAYFREYVNIFFGRFISAINKKTGRPSRFVIPVVLKGMYQETAESFYKNQVEVGFAADDQGMQITMKYDVLPDYGGIE